MQRLLIIGFGMAAARLIQEMRQLDLPFAVTVISEEGAAGPVTRGRRGAKAPAAEDPGMLGVGRYFLAQITNQNKPSVR